MATYTDEQIVAMIQDSTERRELAFEYLYLNTEIKNMAFSKIIYMIKDEVKAEDIFLDSLLAFIKNVKYNKFKGDSKISTYIVSICTFQCLSYLGKVKKEKEKSDLYLTSLTNHTSEEQSPESQIVELEEDRYQAQLKRKIYRQLSKGCREAFREKYGKSFSIKEIAQLKNIAVQSVKNNLSRCYKKLRTLIEGDEEIMAVIKRNHGRL